MGASKESATLRSDNEKKKDVDMKEKEKIKSGAKEMYDGATKEIMKAHEEGETLQKDIIKIQEKQQELENVIGESTEKVPAAKSGKKQTEDWITSRLASVAAEKAKE